MTRLKRQQWWLISVTGEHLLLSIFMLDSYIFFQKYTKINISQLMGIVGLCLGKHRLSNIDILYYDSNL